MNELEELAGVRADVPPMSAKAHIRGRTRLTAAMVPGRAPRRRRTRRALAGALALGVALTGVVTGALLLGPLGDQRPAAAAEVFNRAAAVASADPDPVPRADQYIYREERMLNASGAGPQLHIWSWTAADGSRPGRRRTLDELPTCPSTLTAVGEDGKVLTGAAACDQTTTIPVYQASGGLDQAPYSVLAKLPTSPDALLSALRAGALSAWPMPSGPGAEGITGDVQSWSLIRTLAADLPGPQRAALFRAAAKLTGTTVYPDVTDAAGRVGVGVGMYDPRLGRVVIVFDKTSYRYLGEVIYGHADRVDFTGALLRTAVVDRIGQVPS